MSKATDKFKNDPYVKDYYKTASENEARMQGMDPSGQPAANNMQAGAPPAQEAAPGADPNAMPSATPASTPLTNVPQGNQQ